ncbi:MAG: M56 family metallopeptidase [Saprospiraceae bacterium]
MMTTDLNSVFLQSLGWALAHSIWQITLLALLLAFILPRFENAHGRYWAAFMTLFSAFLVFVGTFLWILFNKFNHLPLAGAVPTAPFQIILDSNNPASSTTGFLPVLSDWLEEHASWVVFFWVAGFCFSLFKLCGGLYYLHRLQRNQVLPAMDFWQNKVDMMRKQLGMLRPVAFLESALVRSPMAWGYFKPLIFFPIGLVNQLSTAEVESILAHELAHIARRDWLFNLLQAFVEAVFYFHPAVWWISAVVCAERENSCDDQAVQLTGDRFMLAKALLHLQQLNAPNAPSTLALGAQGRHKPLYRFSLLTRIQRILNQPSQQKSLIMEKFVATALLLGALTLVGIRANGHVSLAAANNALSETAFAWFGGPDTEQLTTDSVPKPPHRIQKIIQEDNGKRVEMDLNDGKMTRLNIDGNDIPANEWAKHQALTKDVMREVQVVPPPPPPLPGLPPMPSMSPTEMNFTPPMPPMPPMPYHRVSTVKDADGNTTIHLERAGKPMDIMVKNGEVWINGQKIEEGEATDLPELEDLEEVVSIDDQGNYLLLSDDGHKMFYRGGQHSPEISFSRDAQLDMERNLKILDEQRFMSEKDQKKQEKALIKAEKEMRKAEEEMEKQHLKMEKSMREMKVQDEMRAKQRQERRAQ